MDGTNAGLSSPSVATALIAPRARGLGSSHSERKQADGAKGVLNYATAATASSDDASNTRGLAPRDALGLGFFRVSLCLLSSGIGVTSTAQAAINSALGATLGAPAYGAFAAYVIAIVMILMIVVAHACYVRIPLFRFARERPAWWEFGGGLCGGLYMLTAVSLTPTLGVEVFFSLVVVGQLTCSLLLDHLGALGLPRSAAGPAKLVALGIALAGAFVGAAGGVDAEGDADDPSTDDANGTGIPVWMSTAFSVAAVCAGALQPLQATLNWRLGKLLPHKLQAVAVSVAVAGLVSFIATLASNVLGIGPSLAQAVINAGDTQWWMWIGAIAVIMNVAGGATLPSVLSTSLYYVMLLVGELLASLVFDHWGVLGLPVREASAERVSGILLVCAGAVVMNYADALSASGSRCLLALGIRSSSATSSPHGAHAASHSAAAAAVGSDKPLSSMIGFLKWALGGASPSSLSEAASSPSVGLRHAMAAMIGSSSSSSGVSSGGGGIGPSGHRNTAIAVGSVSEETVSETDDDDDYGDEDGDGSDFNRDGISYNYGSRGASAIDAVRRSPAATFASPQQQQQQQQYHHYQGGAREASSSSTPRGVSNMSSLTNMGGGSRSRGNSRSGGGGGGNLSSGSGSSSCESDGSATTSDSYESDEAPAQFQLGLGARASISPPSRFVNASSAAALPRIPPVVNVTVSTAAADEEYDAGSSLSRESSSSPAGRQSVQRRGRLVRVQQQYVHGSSGNGGDAGGGVDGSSSSGGPGHSKLLLVDGSSLFVAETAAAAAGVGTAAVANGSLVSLTAQYEHGDSKLHGSSAIGSGVAAAMRAMWSTLGGPQQQQAATAAAASAALTGEP